VAFFERTLYGKALRATAINRIGARLVGVRTELSGSLSFLLAAFIGALSGILIAPIATIYYDTGLMIGLKGFVGAILGGMTSYRWRRSAHWASGCSSRSRHSGPAR